MHFFIKKGSIMHLGVVLAADTPLTRALIEKYFR
jgi:hypothetical protein